MSFIYSFLQKRKMHENQHGIVMVVIAYALSVLMLALGSDVFYNINTAAAGVNADTEEETHDLIIQSIPEKDATDSSSLMLKSKLMNPYNLADASIASLSAASKGSLSNIEDTVWFLGSAMDTVTFNSLMGQIDSIVPKTTADSENDKAADTKTEKTETTANTYSVKVASNDSAITVSENDVTMLERIVEAEASGEDMVGKILVANVIFNRMADEAFPDTVKGVIFQKVDGDYQFSPVANDRYWSVKVSKETKKAVQRALDGEDYSDGALYFIARKRTSSQSAEWFDDNLKWLFKHGGHEFYKNK
ncbi:MAG TPA: cell wall hydrolase [Mobilitalea sp.]|nr:cell wall hydrolase [Mobilitalea sp.]